MHTYWWKTRSSIFTRIVRLQSLFFFYKFRLFRFISSNVNKLSLNLRIDILEYSYLGSHCSFSTLGLSAGDENSLMGWWNSETISGRCITKKFYQATLRFSKNYIQPWYYSTKSLQESITYIKRKELQVEETKAAGKR